MTSGWSVLPVQTGKQRRVRRVRINWFLFILKDWEILNTPQCPHKDRCSSTAAAARSNVIRYSSGAVNVRPKADTVAAFCTAAVISSCFLDNVVYLLRNCSKGRSQTSAKTKQTNKKKKKNAYAREDKLLQTHVQIMSLSHLTNVLISRKLKALREFPFCRAPSAVFQDRDDSSRPSLNPKQTETP